MTDSDAVVQNLRSRGARSEKCCQVGMRRHLWPKAGTPASVPGRRENILVSFFGGVHILVP